MFHLSHTVPTALTIAGFDGSGGAGILADIKVFAALGCYGVSALTALTAQNTQGVQAIHDLPTHFLSQQFDSLLDDLEIHAIKIGMLSDVEVMGCVEGLLKRLGGKIPCVLDPVMISKSGMPLIASGAIAFLREHLLPNVHVLTPNCFEAEVLLDKKINSHEDQIAAAKAIGEWGVPVVVLKGGHVGSDDRCNDYVYEAASQTGFWLEGRRIQTNNTHGTGCSFSAAVAAGLAKQLPLKKALQEAKIYIQKAIESGANFKIGKGYGPVDHFYKTRG